ncbi:MAG: imidazolonepropionase [Chitinophagales bacterium]
MQKIIGPFIQLIDMANLPAKGPIKSEQLNIIQHAAVIVEDGNIVATGKFTDLAHRYPKAILEEMEGEYVLLPGFVDCHTHICWAGSRANDYGARLDGKTYLEIAEAGGGIWSTVTNTRQATEAELIKGTVQRANHHLKNGVTTVEVKSGYGLGIEEELKILKAIQAANKITHADLVSTCLAAHMKPKDFSGSNSDYLELLINDLLPKLLSEELTNRIDIFIEKSAFTTTEALHYLNKAQQMGFAITVHGDQFSVGGSEVAVKVNALSVDHLEASGQQEIELVATSNTVAVALPGASIGLGMEFTPARKILDLGGALAIGSDWNPGSAPMGDLLTQASILGTYEKLSIAETLAGLTTRAAAALGIQNIGSIEVSNLADFQAYPVDDYREIFYNQGRIKPSKVWKRGVEV